MVLIRRCLQLSPPTLPLTGFHQACCFYSNLTDYCKNNAFTKQIFSSKLLLVGFDFAFVYMCFIGHFFSSAIKELRLASCLQICIDSHLVCLQIMWYSKRIQAVVLYCCYIYNSANINK